MKLSNLFRKLSKDTKNASGTTASESSQCDSGAGPNTPNGVFGRIEIVIPYFDVVDSRFPKYGVPVSVQSSVSYIINDIGHYRELSKSTDYSQMYIEGIIKPIIVDHLKNSVRHAPSKLNVSIPALRGHLLEIGNDVMAQIAPMIQALYGITICLISITDLIIDTESDNYLYLNSITEDVEIEKRVITQNMEISNMKVQHEFDQSNFRIQNESQQELFKTKSLLEQDKMRRLQEIDLGGQEQIQSIQLENQKETMRIQREEMQRAAKLQTEQTFIDAHQINSKLEEAKAAAAATATPTPPTSPLPPTSQTTPRPSTPPQIPASEDYYIAMNQKSVGPFDKNQLQGFVKIGSLTRQTFVWKQGMQNWLAAGDVIELSSIFDE